MGAKGPHAVMTGTCGTITPHNRYGVVVKRDMVCDTDLISKVSMPQGYATEP